MTETSPPFSFPDILYKPESLPYTSLLLSQTSLTDFYTLITSPTTPLTTLLETLNTLYSIISSHPHVLNVIIPFMSKHSLYNALISLYFTHINNSELIELIIKILSLSLKHFPSTKDTYTHLFKQTLSFKSTSTSSVNLEHLTNIIKVFFPTTKTESETDTTPQLKNYITHNGNTSIIVTKILTNKKLSLNKPLNVFIWFSINEQGDAIASQLTQRKHSLAHIEFLHNKSLEVKLSDTYTKLTIVYYDGAQVLKEVEITQNIDIIKGNWYLIHMHLSAPSVFSNDSYVKVINTFTSSEVKTAIPFKKSFFTNNTDITNLNFFTNFYGLSTSIYIITDKINDIQLYKLKSIPYGPNTFLEVRAFMQYLLQFNKNLLDSLALVYNPMKFNVTSKQNIIVLDDISGNNNTGVITPIANNNNNTLFKRTVPCHHCKPHKRIYHMCDINCILFLYESTCEAAIANTLTQDNFDSVIALTTDIITTSRYNFLSALTGRFFIYLSAFLEQIPSQYYSASTLDYFMTLNTFYITHYAFFQQSLLSNDKALRSFIKYIIVNRNIILKFSDNNYKQIWEQIGMILKKSPGVIMKNLSIEKILRFLLSLDKHRYNKFCCDIHYNAITSSSASSTTDIADLSTYINPLSTIIIHIIQHNITQNQNDYIQLLTLLSFDVSPCLQKFLITTFTTFINKEDTSLTPFQLENMKKLFIDNSIKDVLLFVLTVSLPDVRVELIHLIIILTDKFPILFDNKSKLFIKDNILAGIIKPNYAVKELKETNTNTTSTINSNRNSTSNNNSKEYLPSDNISIISRNSTESMTNVIENLRKKYQYYKKYLSTYLESNNDFNLNYIKIKEGSKLTFADFPQMNHDYILSSIDAMYNRLFKWLNYCVNDAQFIRDVDRYNNSNQIFAILIGFISKLNEPQMINTFLKDINVFFNKGKDTVMYFKIILHSKDFMHFLLENYLHFSIDKDTSTTNSDIALLCYQTLITFITMTLNVDPENMLMCYLIQWCHYHYIISSDDTNTNNTNTNAFNKKHFITTFLTELISDVINNDTLLLKTNTKLSDNTNFSLTLFTNILFEVTSLFQHQKLITEEPVLFIQMTFPSYTYISLDNKLPQSTINLISSYLSLTKPFWNIYTFVGAQTLRKAFAKSHSSKKEISEMLIDTYIKPHTPYATFEILLTQLSYCFRFSRNKNISSSTSTKSQVNNKTFYQPIAMMKVIMHLLITKLEFAETIEMFGETLEQFETFIMFVLLSTTNMSFGLRKETKLKEAEVKVIQDMSYQVIIYCLYYMLKHYYNNEDKRVRHLFGESFDFIMGMMYYIIDKGNVKNYVDSAIHRMFYSTFIVTEADDKGEIVIDPASIDYIGFMEVYGKENNTMWNKVLLENKELIRNIGEKVFEKKVVITNALFYFCETRNILPLHMITELPTDINTLEHLELKLGNNYTNIESEYMANRIQDNLIERINEIRNGLMLRELQHVFKKDQIKKTYVKMKQQLLHGLGISEIPSEQQHIYNFRNHYSTEMSPFLYKQQHTSFYTTLLPLCFQDAPNFALNVLKDESRSSNDNVNYLKDIYMKCYKGEIWQSITNWKVDEIDNVKGLFKCVLLNNFQQRNGLMIARKQHIIFTSSDGRVRERKPINLISKKISIAYENIMFIFSKSNKGKEGIEMFTAQNKLYSFELINATANELINYIKKNYNHFSNSEIGETTLNFGCLINLKCQSGKRFNLRKLNLLYKQWNSNQITSFEFLNWLNVMAGRSWCHYELYPIIPFTLSWTDDKKIESKTFPEVSDNEATITACDLTKDEVEFWLQHNSPSSQANNIDIKSITVIPPQILTTPELINETVFPLCKFNHKYSFSLELRQQLELSNTLHNWITFAYGKGTTTNNSEYKPLFETPVQPRIMPSHSYISNKGTITPCHLKKKTSLQSHTSSGNLLYINFNKDKHTIEAITDTFKLISFKTKLKESTTSIVDEKTTKIPNKLDEVFFNGRNSTINTNCIGKRQSLIIGSYFILSGFWDKNILILHISDSSKSFSLLNEYDNSSITYIDKDMHNHCVIFGTAKGSVVVYRVNPTPLKFEFHIGKHEHKAPITALVMNNTLQLVASASKDGVVNIYTYPSFKTVRSIVVDNNACVTNVFLASNPLPCVVAYSTEKKRFYSYTINGETVEMSDNEENETWNAFSVYQGKAFQEFLMLGSENGVFEIRMFPELKIRHKLVIASGSSIKEIVPLGKDGSVLVCLDKMKEIVILENISKE